MSNDTLPSKEQVEKPYWVPDNALRRMIRECEQSPDALHRLQAHVLKGICADLLDHRTAHEPPAGPPWEFDRYQQGRVMAQGIVIEREATFEAAALKASRMADRLDVLVLRRPSQPPPVRQCNHGALSPKGTMFYHGFVGPANRWRCDVCKGEFEGNLTEPNTPGSQSLTLVSSAPPPGLNHDESVMLLQDAEDAKRYRFLRDQRRWYANTPPAPGVNIKFEYLIADNGEALDAAIDKELDRATATKGEG
jgi:hypothetical protein